MSRRSLIHTTVLALCILFAALHQWQVWAWFIEDSAITFAYARNLANGEGLVPWPGGERIEGYSNPTWTALIAFLELFGVIGFSTAKTLALICTAWTLFACYFLTKRAIPNDPHGDAALLAPVVLAGNSVYAMWAGSGLENALFGAFLVTALWRLSVEFDEKSPQRPWSALLFFGLALTRPEGILYGAAAGLWVVIHAWHGGKGWRPLAAWATAILAPFAAITGLRLWYFAWPLPMTYYAKVGTGGTVIHQWNGRGWMQLRSHAQILWQGWFIPIYALGLLGFHGRFAKVLPAVVGGGFAMMWLPLPDLGLQVRIVVLLLMAGVLPLASVGNPGWTARAPAWSMAAVTVFFAAYANGDWMRGWRWMSLLAGPASVLFAAAAWEVGQAVQHQLKQPTWRAPSWVSAVLLVALTVPPNWANTVWFADEGKNETPWVIRRRVQMTHNLASRLFIDEPVVNVDMDMGAFLWWGKQRMVDVAGLVDVPIALHTFRDKPFVQEYIFQQQRPHIVHMHGHWDVTTELTEFADFKANWIELPPWKDGKRLHSGEFIRRDLFMQPSWTPTEDTKVNFAGGASLQGWDMPNRTLGKGRAFYLDTAWKTWTRRPNTDFRVFAVISNGSHLATWARPMGYDWLSMDQWGPDEVFRGQYALEVPNHIKKGIYDLGFAILDHAGKPLPAGGFNQEAYVSTQAIVPGEDAHYLRGEVRFTGVVEVVAHDAVDSLAASQRQVALQRADEGACDAAEQAWRTAWLQLPKHDGWKTENQPEIAAALSRCYAVKAAQDAIRAPELLAKAHDWDHREPTFLDVRRPIANTLYQQALDAESAGDFERAFWLYTDLLSFQPTHAWARRHAEICRNERLGLGPLKMWGRLQRRKKTAQ
ncbi:MAG: hypothetical protein GWP91_16605 [Rhodobacterales bacterium]|nr:hypothetical protein [Rhodobacterales bacterium]